MTLRLDVHAKRSSLVLSIGGILACGDGQAGTSTGETSSGTSTQTTAVVESGSGSSTSSPDSSGRDDALMPWYGAWYARRSNSSVNTPRYWGDGGDSLATTNFTLHPDSATIEVKNCLWGWDLRFEYILILGDEGATELQPVGGVHEYQHSDAIERLYLRPGEDCSTLALIAVDPQGEESDLFGAAGTPLARGMLCLEKCAEKQGDWGIITDCGTPVPWPCSE